MRIVLLMFLILPFLVFAQDKTKENDYELFVISQSAPYEMWDLFQESGLDQEYNINLTHLNPFYYQADFDGDSKIDFAVLLSKKGEDLDRLAILSGSKNVFWLDKSDELAYPQLTAWHVHPKSLEVETSPFEDTNAPKLIGDGLMIIKVEASSALIYWNGNRFISYWQGD
jgi:hypothetical protein